MSTKVLMFGWEFPPHNSGGLGTACEGLARALQMEGAEVTFVLPREIPVSLPGVRFVFAGVPLGGRGAYLPEGEFGRLYGGSLVNQVELYAERAREIARREQFDVIHAHDWLSSSAGLVAKEVSGKPLIVHFHATEFDRTGGAALNPVVYEIERRAVQLADVVVAVSNFTKQILVDRYHGDPHKITVVHNGVGGLDSAPVSEKEGPEALEDWGTNLEALKRNDQRIVLFLGRITLQKGPDYFLRAAKRVLESYPNVRFIVAGSGDMENQIVGLSAELGISNKVLFAGFVRGKELTALYRAADLYVMPSVSEPFGIAPLESLVQGTPVLISKQSGVSEVIKHALVADFWDVDDMADKIISALKYPSLHHSLKTNGRREALGATWKKAAEKISAIYTKIVDFLRNVPKV